jgi:hypothetical protein
VTDSGVRVRVTLQLTVSQSVRLGVEPVFATPVFIPELVPGVDVTATADWLAG